MPCLDFLSVIFQSWLLSATLVPSINYLKINAWWQTKSFLIITQYHQRNSMEEISLNISWEKKSRTKHGRSFTKFHWFTCFLPQYLVPVSKASLHPPNLKPRLTHLSQHEGSWGLPPQSVILSKQRPRGSSAGTTFCPLTIQDAIGCSMVGWTQVSPLRFQTLWSYLLQAGDKSCASVIAQAKSRK